MADERFSGNSANTGSLLEVLLALKANIFRDLKVASMATVKEIKGDTIAVSKFPLIQDEPEKVIYTINGSGQEINPGDIVIVIFMDRNFLQNLQQAQSNIKMTPLKDLKDLHNEKYGVIIHSFNSAASENTYPTKWTSSFINNVLNQTLEMNDGTELKNSVSISIPTVKQPIQVSISGDTITDSQLSSLQDNDFNTILYQNEIYYLSQKLDDKLIYNMTSFSESVFTLKSITITLSTKAIEYYSQIVGSGSGGVKGPLYKSDLTQLESIPENPTAQDDSLIVVDDQIYVLQNKESDD